jgi:pyruvate dehydrogenase E1 component alpha subunit
MTRVAQFEIHHSAFLGAQGEILRPLPVHLDDPQTLTELYRWLTLTRCFDAKAVALQRTGRLGTYASSLGQEAVSIGTAHGMHADDVLLPSFREHGTQLYRGVQIEELLLFWGGDERGSDFSLAREDFPICVTVGGHAPHAAGVALAFKLRGQARAAVCVFGDGATSKGEVYEAMNLAGLWQLPLVFVIANNQWAISTRRAEQSAAQTLAQKALAAGFTGEQVDGNDIIAVSDVIGRAVLKARAGDGPHLVECLTYRLADHTTSDDASRYRDDEEVSRWWQQDPIARLRLYLGAQHGWSEKKETALLDNCKELVETATQTYLTTAPQAPESIFDHLYAHLPHDLESQRDDMLRFAQDQPEEDLGRT